MSTQITDLPPRPDTATELVGIPLPWGAGNGFALADVNARYGDETEGFQFSIGQAF